MTIEVGFLDDDKGLVMSEWFDCSMSFFNYFMDERSVFEVIVEYSN